MMDEMEKIYEFEAIIENIKFYNDETNYHIMTFRTTANIPHVIQSYNGKYGTLVGYCVQCDIGDTVKVKAKLVQNPKYGYQYSIESLSFDKPMTPDALYAFLSAIISEAQATVLYNAYPDIVDRVIENENFEPDYKLLKGIGKSRWEKIRHKIISSLGYAELITLLAPVGCTLHMIQKIAKGNKDLTLLKKQIIENPYMLCDIPNMGFKKVDGFAIKLNPGIAESVMRIKSCITYILEMQENDNGNSFISKDLLKQEFKRIIYDEIPYKKLDKFLESQEEIFKQNPKDAFIYVKDNNVGLIKTYIMEEYIFDKLKTIAKEDNIWDISYNYFFEQIEQTAKKQGFYLSEEQMNAVRSVAENNITVISGKAGTGKSSVIKAILEVYKNHNIGMAALSAKAAKRMREVTGFENAQTIHRLLKYRQGVGFLYNEREHLPYDLLILDECSMNNVYLFYAILKASNPNMKIILSGDYAQLPSIGVGSVFSDLIKYPYFNNHNLTKIYRQSEESFIVEHANVIREGIMPFDIEKGTMMFGTDTLYMFRNASEQVRDSAVALFLKFLETTDIQDIAIVCPRKDQVCVSCKSMNVLIQNALLPKADNIEYNDKEFRIGCRVINKKNDYDKGILNGDLGTVIKINDKKSNFSVQFDEGNVVDFIRSDMKNLELGYALSVHSSQGSQYKICIVAMDMTSYTLLSSNMVYTAMTRAIDKLIVISQPNAFFKAVRNVEENNRNTYLKLMLEQYDPIELYEDKKDKVYKHKPELTERGSIITQTPLAEKEPELDFLSLINIDTPW